MKDDDENAVVAYVDHTFLFGRKVYRDITTGDKVDDTEVDAVISTDPPPLLWYFGFGRR